MVRSGAVSYRCDLDPIQDSSSDVLTLHVLFTKFHAPSVIPRPFPRVVRQVRKDHIVGVSEEAEAPVAPDSAQLRAELIEWIAEEALGGDRQAAEWILLSSISRV